MARKNFRMGRLEVDTEGSGGGEEQVVARVDGTGIMWN